MLSKHEQFWIEALFSGKFSTDDPFTIAPADDDQLSIRRFGMKKTPALFLNFCEATSSQKLMEFMTKLLAVDLPSSIKALEGEVPLNASTIAEGLAPWLPHVQAMRRCVELWKCLRANDADGLASHIRWGESKGEVWYEERSGSRANERQVIASAQKRPWYLAEFAPGELSKPAAFYVQDVINEHVTKLAEVRVLWDMRRMAMCLHFVPRNFVGAMWLQFARAFTGNLDHDRCPQCGTWFEVSLHGSRTSRQYCKPACKQEAYRDRKDNALKSYRQGMKIREIAKQVGSDVDTIKRWISSRKEK